MANFTLSTPPDPSTSKVALHPEPPPPEKLSVPGTYPAPGAVMLTAAMVPSWRVEVHAWGGGGGHFEGQK